MATFESRLPAFGIYPNARGNPGQGITTTPILRPPPDILGEDPNNDYAMPKQAAMPRQAAPAAAPRQQASAAAQQVPYGANVSAPAQPEMTPFTRSVYNQRALDALRAGTFAQDKANGVEDGQARRNAYVKSKLAQADMEMQNSGYGANTFQNRGFAGDANNRANSESGANVNESGSRANLNNSNAQYLVPALGYRNQAEGDLAGARAGAVDEESDTLRALRPGQVGWQNQQIKDSQYMMPHRGNLLDAETAKHLAEANQIDNTTPLLKQANVIQAEAIKGAAALQKAGTAQQPQVDPNADHEAKLKIAKRYVDMGFSKEEALARAQVPTAQGGGTAMPSPAVNPNAPQGSPGIMQRIANAAAAPEGAAPPRLNPQMMNEAAQAPPQVKTPAEAAKLPPGTVFVDPQGVRRQVPQRSPVASAR